MSPRSRGSASSGPGRGRRPGRPSRRTRNTRRTTRVPAEPTTEPEEPVRNNGKIAKRAAILLLVLAVLSVSYASSIRAWMRQQDETAALHQEIATRKAAVHELEQAKRRWHDPAYIKQQARLRFGWLMPGETGYRVIGPHGTVWQREIDQSPEPKTRTSKSEPPWWESTWRSVQQAGKSGSDADAQKQQRQPPSEPKHQPAEKITPGE